MVVLILEKVPASLRGEISRWMIEPKTGVFVGKLSAQVRDRLYNRAVELSKGGAVTLIHTSNTEQGFDIRTFGIRDHKIIDAEGIWLVKRITTSSP